MAGLGDTSSGFDFSSILSDAINAYSTITQAKTAASIAKTQAAAARPTSIYPPTFPGGFNTAYNPQYSPMYSSGPITGGSNFAPIMLAGGAGLLLLMLMKA